MALATRMAWRFQSATESSRMVWTALICSLCSICTPCCHQISLALTVFSPLFCSLVLILLSSSHSTDFCSLCSLLLTVLSAHLCSLCSHLLTAFCLLLFVLSNAHWGISCSQCALLLTMLSAAQCSLCVSLAGPLPGLVGVLCDLNIECPQANSSLPFGLLKWLVGSSGSGLKVGIKWSLLLTALSSSHCTLFFFSLYSSPSIQTYILSPCIVRRCNWFTCNIYVITVAFCQLWISSLNDYWLINCVSVTK